jgi:hypothetical protein
VGVTSEVFTPALPGKYTAFDEDEYVTVVPVPYGVAVYPLPVLSIHVAIVDPELNVKVEASAPSNHSEHPTILRGSNFDVRLENPSIVYLE